MSFLLISLNGIGKCGEKNQAIKVLMRLRLNCLSVGQSSVLMNIGSNWLKFHFLRKKTNSLKNYTLLNVSIIYCSAQFSSVQSLSRVQLFATPWTTAHQASLSITNSWSSPKLMSELVMPSSHLILCRPLLLLPLIPPSIRVFSKESTLRTRWPKYWNFSFNISPSNEHPGLFSFRMDWWDLLAVQGTLKSFSNTTVQNHQFFGSQLSSQSNSHIHTWPQEKP